jgi:hypothetical protein
MIDSKESVQGYLTLAQQATTTAERDSLVRKAVELARSRVTGANVTKQKSKIRPGAIGRFAKR